MTFNNLYSLLFLTFVVSISSCKKDDSKTPTPTPTPIPTPTTENTWKLNSFGFERSRSFQNSTTYTNGDFFTQVVIDSKISSKNGNFKYCQLVFWYNTSTEGIYTTKSVNTLVSFTTLQYINIKCTVSDVAGKGAVYESTDTNNPVIVKKVNNSFILTTSEPITLTRTLDDGLDNSPNTLTFVCDKVN